MLHISCHFVYVSYFAMMITCSISYHSLSWAISKNCLGCRFFKEICDLNCDRSSKQKMCYWFAVVMTRLKQNKNKKKQKQNCTHSILLVCVCKLNFVAGLHMCSRRSLK